MDSHATLKRLLDAIIDGDEDEFNEAAHDLAPLLKWGNRRPSVERMEVVTRAGLALVYAFEIENPRPR